MYPQWELLFVLEIKSRISLFTPLPKTAETAKICKTGTFFIWLESEVLCKGLNTGFCPCWKSYLLVHFCRNAEIKCLTTRALTRKVMVFPQGKEVSSTPVTDSSSCSTPVLQKAHPPGPAPNSEAEPGLNTLPKSHGEGELGAAACCGMQKVLSGWRREDHDVQRHGGKLCQKVPDNMWAV